MNIHTTKLPGVLILVLNTYKDNRGFFSELFREDAYSQLGITTDFVQYNHSRSNKNVLRGLHYQLKHAQGKLVTVIHGAILDVVADINPKSPTFGKWIAQELSDQNKRQIYIPPGYAHGFITLSAQVDLLYACTDYYHQEDSFAINWSDPTLNIAWPIKEPILSTEDKNASFLSEMSADKLPKIIFSTTK